jgi:fatty acid desaturase
MVPTVPVAVACFVVIATQQYAILVLMHDGQHSLLHPRRSINNLISKWLIGAPCGTPFLRSQALHLAHHQTVGSTDDPAFQFYCFGEPSPKGSFVALVVHFVRVIVLRRLGHSVFSDPRKPSTRKSEGVLASYGPVLMAQAAMFGVFTAAGIWWAYFALWLLPLATLVSFFDAFRQFGEHAEPRPDQNAGSRLISTLSNPVERTLIAPFGMNYHAEHHMFPFVPYYRLRQLSALIRESEAASAIQWRRSYLSSLAIYLRAL